MNAPVFFERPISWSHVMAATLQSSSDKQSHGQKGTETTCVLPIHRALPVRHIRDWLDNELHGRFELRGIYYGSSLFNKDLMPIGLRFLFEDFDDKLIFALRWL